VTVGKKLANKILVTDTIDSFTTYLGKRISLLMFLEPPRNNEIYNYIHSLKLRKSSGYDNIDVYFIRIAYDIFVPYLTHLCMLSFEFDIFLTVLKLQKSFQYIKLIQKLKQTTTDLYIFYQTC